jgi:hypothetical protein
MKAGKKNVLSELKAAIGKQIKPPPAPAAPPKDADKTATPEMKGAAHALPEAKVAPALKTPLRSGRGVQFYLDDRDRKLITNLAVWLGSQDRRVSDSQVIKAAIRFASINPNARLLEICDEVRASDRRRHARKPKRSAEK